MSTLTCTLYYINMFVCVDSYILICMTTLLVKETALLVREGQPRALYESRDTVPFSWRRRISLCANVLVWYIVHVMCSISFRLPVVDLFFLGRSYGIDKGKAPA